MDIEFHYYYTYLIATKAGFTPNEAHTVAHSSQYVDDNNYHFRINRNTSEYYENKISQTIDITKPSKEIMHIYPLFHFIPGDANVESAARKDGKMHILNTTPNSKNANLILHRALMSNNLYRIGIAIHAFADTFAHQNFTGSKDHFNATKGMLEDLMPNVGHASAGHKPDYPCLIWYDDRLLAEYVNIVNRRRFLDAARAIYLILRRYKYPLIPESRLEAEVKQLLIDFELEIMIEDDPDNELMDVRIKRCQSQAVKKEYGGVPLPSYDQETWIGAAIDEDINLFDKRKSFISQFSFPSLAPEVYTWKNIDTYKTTDWYLFQEAVKKHIEEAFDTLNNGIFRMKDLDVFSEQAWL